MQDLKDSFKETKKLYEKHFGKYPNILNDAARCEDHACHVKSPCACRVESACKDDIREIKYA